MVGGEATGSEQGANRPAVVVSNDTGNRYAPIVEVVYLTTRLKSGMPTHVFVGSAERPSIALCEQIVTVCKSRLERRIGRVTAEEMKNIDRALKRSLGIHRTGGNAMEVTIKTPFGDMNFDMPQEGVSDLLQRAFQIAAGQEPQVEQTPRTEPQEPPKQPKAVSRPQSRVERMFGNFKTGDEATDLTDAPEEVKATIIRNAEELERRDEPQAYKGFLLVKCEECGKIRGFCAKNPATSSRCECGHRTELRDLKPAYLKCKCGSQFKYKTNITDETFDYTCLNCGGPIDVQLNKRRDTYVTIE